MHKTLLFIFCIFLQYHLSAQSFFPIKKYPSSSYANPMDFPISLAGNFGECRPNHFHSGMDIRTNKVENQLVHAIHGGFVSRVLIEPGGFGNAIYITNVDGYTALYAHLNKFYPELEAYVRKKQYESKSWKQDMYFLPQQFPVRKGMFIAWSGNTGSSEAPHLHMEIRNTKTDAPLNGLLFYKGLTDTKAPIAKQLALYDGNKSINEQKPIMIPLSKKGGVFQPANTKLTINSNKAYIGICGDDYMEIATGTLGIFEMRMYVNESPFFGWQLDNISYDSTRYMNALADYKTKKNGGPWIQLCRKLPNDKLGIYKSYGPQNGLIDVSDGKEKKIRIELSDTKNNTSTIEFSIQGKAQDSKIICENEFIAGKKNTFKNASIEFTLPEDCLYDNVCFKSSLKPSTSMYSHIYQVHYPYVPLHSYFDLKLKPKTLIPANLKDKIAIVRYPYSKETSKKGKVANLVDTWVVANVRDFGEYEIVIDQKAPSITSSIKNNDVVTKLNRLTFVVKDETTSIKSCTATLDGQWLRLVQKGDMYYYEFDGYFEQGKHEFIITACDENGNSASKTYNLIR